MTDTEPLIRCPWCLFAGIRVTPGVYITAFRMKLPHGAAVEVRYLIYRCPQCGRGFSEEDLNQDDESKTPNRSNPLIRIKNISKENTNSY